MSNKYENNHFIQKALAKNWADKDGNIKYMVYDDKREVKTFNINDPNWKHPISKKHFYSEEIEKGMNRIEKDGIQVIKKINEETIYSKEITITRKELCSLKYYLVLSNLRTEKFRDNIKQKTGNSYFNKLIELDKRTPIEIHESMIKKLIDWYNAEITGNYENSLDKAILKIYEEFLEEFSKNSNDSIQNQEEFENKFEKFKLKNFNSDNIARDVLKKSIVDCRIIIFKFQSDKLLLPEANSFEEYYNAICQPGLDIYSFYPISPSTGIMLFNVNNVYLYGYESSKIFKSDNLKEWSKNKYVNQKKIDEETISEFAKLNFNIPPFLKEKINKQVIAKYKDLNDKYTYKIKKERNETALFCNAMMLVHNRNHLILFQDKEIIDESEKIIAEKGIYRSEDYN